MLGDLQRAARILKQGGIVAYATEYCFGLGCDPQNRAAVLRLLRVKRRPVSKGLILIAAELGQLQTYADNFPPAVLASWPGPHSWLLTPRPKAPRWIVGKHLRIAVRVTAHQQAAALCLMAGMAIVSTSANRAGQMPARSFRETRQRLGASVDYLLPGFVGDARAPTPIRDAASGKVVRAG